MSASNGSPELDGRVRAAGGPSGSSRLRDRRWFALNAVVVWSALVADAVVIALGAPSWLDVHPGDFGYGQAEGLAGIVGNALDYASYFTTWSLLTAAVVVTILALDLDRDGRALRAGRLASVLMLTVTVVATAVALPVWVAMGGGVLATWQIVLQVLRHVVAPLLTLLIWVALGPRGWIDRSTALWSLTVPLAWIGWTFARGAVIDAYPYEPMNVVALGYGPVLAGVAAVTVAGAVLLALLIVLDARLGRRLAASQAVLPPVPEGARSGTPST